MFEAACPETCCSGALEARVFLSVPTGLYLSGLADVIRCDRGPEMVNMIMEEIMSVMNIRQVTGASLTPRHQGKVERSHQVLMRSHLILMHKITMCFPQECPTLVPALEYLYATTPQGRYGLSAEDISCGYAMAASRELLLLRPFQVPEGVAETDTAQVLFRDFKTLYGIFTSCLREEAKLPEIRVNENRRARRLSPGDVVFWQIPHQAKTTSISSRNQVMDPI